MKKIIGEKVAVVAIACCLMSSAVIAEEITHKEKSTIDNFPFEALEQEDLSEAVIAGGLEPTSAGAEDETALTPLIGEQYELEIKDKQSDLGNANVQITFGSFRESRDISGVQRTYSSAQAPFRENTNRTYHSYDVGVSGR